MSMPARKDILTILLALVIVVMGIEIVVLTVQNRKLRGMLLETTQYQPLQADQQVPPLSGKDLDGNTVEIRYGADSPFTVLIWLSPSCHICRENLGFWNELYVNHRSSRYRYLALCAGTESEARGYVVQHKLNFPVVSLTDDTLVSAYNGYVLPQTAIISPTGSIVNVWPGALDSLQQQEIVTLLARL